MKSDIDFLNEINDKRLRKEIRNICGSYTHPWDILAELCQNALDAIIRYLNKFPSEVNEHKITIEIDCNKRSIRVRDTGIGIDINSLSQSLAPHGTDKEEDLHTIGEKGVGLTFAIFSANLTQLKSRSERGSFIVEVNGAYAWKSGLTEKKPIAKIIKNSEVDSGNSTYGTEVILNDVERIHNDNNDIFNFTVHRLIYLLQTRTAIGYLNKVWGKDFPEIKVELIYSDTENEKEIIPIEFGYRTPSSFINKRDVINYDDFLKQAATMSDNQKSAKLRGKALEIVGDENRAGRKIRYYAFYAPSRNLWKTISNQNFLEYTNENGELVNEIKGGIFLSTKGMPTGIELIPPVSGQMSYWANLYVVIEDSKMDFDLGRKSIPSSTQAMYKDISKKLFVMFTQFNKFITSDPSVNQTIATVQNAQKQKVFESLNTLNDLGIDKINYLKYPNGQEASVIAIFHELVGSKLLKGYYALRHGYKLTYDFWGKYNIDSKIIGEKYTEFGHIDIPIIVEFKYKGQDILDDVENNQKFFIDMDLIVCWDLDVKKFNERNIQVKPINKDEVFFYGSNFELNWPSAYDLGSASKKPVLCLRQFIEDYVSHN